MLSITEHPQSVVSHCEVSVIMPAYNEEEYIAQAVWEVDCILRGISESYEIVVVDDGSVDQTRRQIQNYARTHQHIKVVGYSHNMGKGYALKYGFSQAAGEKIILLDGDRNISPEQIGAYLKALEGADIAIASKRHPQSKVKSPLKRKFLSRAFHLLAKLLVGVKVSDTQTGLKAFRRRALDAILKMQRVRAYAFDVEVLALAAILRMQVVELPVKMELTGDISFRSILRMFSDLLGIAYRLRVKRSYQCSLS
ncbi:MAG: glycosyltransferase family 2 protein [Candidatus Bathyarchaeia archaeon]